MMNKSCLVIVTVFFLCVMVFGQEAPKTYVHKFGDGDFEKNWVARSKTAEVVQYKGKTALRIKEGPGQGFALLKKRPFVNGVIELDIAAVPKFTGIAFRVQGMNDYEGIYFRPQNSRNPQKRNNTVQYIGHPKHTWRFLRETAPGKYEAHADIAPGEWFHVKIVVKDLEAKVYVNNAKTPCLVVKDLKRGITRGAVGVWCGNTSGGTFANFKVTPKKTNKPLTNPKVPARKSITIDPNVFKPYTGKYQMEAAPDFFVIISTEGGRFYTQATNQPRFEIFPESKDKFFLKLVDAQIAFVKDDAGKVTGMVVQQGGRDMRLKKIE